MIYQFLQDLINQYLKRNRSVDKLKRHNFILEMIITNAERCYSLFVLAYFNLMIYIFKIELDRVRSVHKAI